MVRNKLPSIFHKKWILMIGILIIASIILVIESRTKIQRFLVTERGIDFFTPVLFIDKARDPEFNFKMAESYYGKGKVYNAKKAIKYYNKTIQLDPTYPFAHYQLARVYFVTGALDAALYEINEELRYHPENGRSYYVRGLINGYSDKLKYAVNDFHSYIKWNPNTWAGRNDLAWVYFQLGEYELVRQTALEGLQFSPQNPWLLNSVGLAYQNLNQPEQAIEYYTNALKEAETLSADDWGQAYPGNDPKFYSVGFEAMKNTIRENMRICKEQVANKKNI